MSMRFQVTLPEALLLELKQVAAEVGVSAAEFIREAVEERLRRRAGREETDPFASIAGLVESEETDLASPVDETLYR
jgi:metal-responsive CopG/Arc/MetJ family transcriptional regulator